MKEINAKETFELVKEGKARLCDVRTAQEWEEEGYPDVKNLLKITWKGDPQNFLEELEKEGQREQIIFICRGGIRSATTAAIAFQAGYDSYNLIGGFKAWTASLLPIKK